MCVYFIVVNFIFFTCVGLDPTAIPKPSSTVMGNYSPQRQEDILVVSQPSSLVCVVNDIHTTTSPVTTLNVVECLTTSNTGQNVSTMTPAGVYMLSYCVATYIIYHSNATSNWYYTFSRFYLFL